MWLVLPIFGRVLGNSGLAGQVGVISAFLGGFSTVTLGVSLLMMMRGVPVAETVVGRSAGLFLRQGGITGPFVGTFTFWMTLCAFAGKIVVLTLIITASPFILILIYHLMKSLNWSVEIFHQVWGVMPQFVQKFFHSSYNVVIQEVGPWVNYGGEKGFQWMKYISLVKISFVILDYLSGVPYIGTILEGLGNFWWNLNFWALNNTLIGPILNGLYDTVFFCLGSIVAVSPIWLNNFIVWVFSADLLHNEWYRRLIGWIGLWTGWW